MTAPDALSPDTIAARLAGTPEERAVFVRELADAGYAEAEVIFAQMLLDGVGVAKDERAAVRWFVRAAAQGHLLALNMVGRCYDLGWGVPVDRLRAAECFRVAAERGLAWAMYNYATLLALGEGVAEDKEAALVWLHKAAVTGEGLCCAKAINFVGSFAEDGWAGPVDMVWAARCYREAAAGGDFRGCFNHARMLRDIDAALPWLRRAGELGNARFVAQMLDWLARCPWPEFATRGVAAVREAAGC